MRFAVLCALVTLLLTGAARAQRRDQVLAQVGGASITLQQVIAADPAAKSDAKLRQKVLILLINRQAVLNAAHKAGIEKTAEYREAVDKAKQNVAIGLMAKQYADAHPVTEKQIKARYDALFDKPAPKQYRLREILTDTYKAAHLAMERIRHGEDFSIVAADVSKDGATAQIGGELGWQFAARLPAPILKAVRTLRIGQVAGPVSVPQGDAVVQLLGERTAPKPGLEAVKQQIGKQLRQEHWLAHVIKLRTAQNAHLIVPLSGR